MNALVPTSDWNVEKIAPLPTPAELIKAYHPSDKVVQNISESRRIIQNILVGKDPRFLVVVGPCSIHDVDLALEYSSYIPKWQAEFPNLYLVMRVYFEKPRSRLGWKGFIYDPNLDESFDIRKGLNKSRELLLKLAESGIPIGCEFLDTLTPQYLSDLVSWGAIGARTSESQVHRQLSSGLSMPVGFKNPTNGNYKMAIDGIISASYPHHFLSLNYDGQASVVQTKGNKFCHLILRGGTRPNYFQNDIEEMTEELKKDKIETGMVIDCSHGNSEKFFKRQLLVALSVNRLRLFPKYPIRGVMIESNINEGNQPLKMPLKHGVSITDGCLGLEATHLVLSELNHKPEKRFEDLADIRAHIKDLEAVFAACKGDGILQAPQPRFDAPEVVINLDAEIYSHFNTDHKIMWFVHRRVSLGESIAKLKFEANPFSYMLKENDFYSLITDRNIEIDIVQRTGEPLFMGIMELTKKVQSCFLEAYTLRKKIGYLGTKGTFSSQAVNQFFRGQHIGYATVDELVRALKNKEVDFMLLPTYNSIVGKFALTDETLPEAKGRIEYPIHLATLGNAQFDLREAEVLYVQRIVQLESVNYLKKFKQNMEVIVVKSTEEGCKKCITDPRKAITIASIHNVCPFLHCLEDSIVDHNVTSFSFFCI